MLCNNILKLSDARPISATAKNLQSKVDKKKLRTTGCFKIYCL